MYKSKNQNHILLKILKKFKKKKYKFHNHRIVLKEICKIIAYKKYQINLDKI